VIVGFLIASVALLYFPLVARPIGRRMNAREWARVTTGAVATGAAGLYLSLLAIALATMLRGVGGSKLVRLCDELLGHLPHGGPWLGWLVVVVLTASTWKAAVAYRSVRRKLSYLCVEEHIGQHWAMGGVELVVLPTSQHIAYSRDGVTRQIVVSQGIVDSLSGDQLDVLIEHERCHLARRDELVLTLFAVVASVVGWLPGLGRSIVFSRLARERAADEVAARDCPARRRALAEALVAVSRAVLIDAAPAFSRVEALEERVAAMRGGFSFPPPTHRWLVRGTATGLRVVVGSGAITVALVAMGACSR
jgi:hypothetical protein